MRLKLHKHLCRIFLLAMLGLQFANANAVTFTSITAIGDSLFDGGNEPTAVISAYKIYGLPSGVVPAPGYYNYKYCDGYTAIEYFAYFMGMYDVNHFFNFAVAGMETTNLPLALQQIYKRNATLDPTGLYVVFLGGNDIFQSTITRDQVAQNITDAVVDLYNHGARFFMILNQPKLSDAPNYNSLSTPQIEAVDIAYLAVNSALKTKLDALPFTASVAQIDTAHFSQLVTQYALSVGFTNTTDACIVNGIACATPHTYVYWDDVHFSDNTNSFLGSYMKSSLDAAGLR